MIDIKLEYKANFFADLEKLSPTPKTLSTLIELFEDKEMIPSVFQEAVKKSPGFVNRIQVGTQSNNWLIFLPTKFMSIEKHPLTSNGEDMGSIKDFSEESINLSKRVFREFNLKSNRLSLITSYLAKEMSEEQLSNVYHKLMIPHSVYRENPPYEWNNRTVTKVKRTIAGREEYINIISKIDRIQGELNSPELNLPFDRIQLNFDINTHQDNKDYRFDHNNYDEFFEIASTINEDLINQLEEIINV